MSNARIAGMTLILTRAQAQDYARLNQYAVMMFTDAGSDYVAGRCCMLNGLFPGLRLASEAVEKILKAFIFLATGHKSMTMGNDRHNPYLLKQELRKIHMDSKLDVFDGVLTKLHDHFQSRYYDNPTKSKDASTSELAQIDELFIYLVETLPMPDEVKYRTLFFAQLCDANAKMHWRGHYWTTLSNGALNGKMGLIERRYQEVFEHLYQKIP